MKLKLIKIAEEQKEHDIYTEQGLSQKTEDDEISDFEEAFMKGWLSID